MIVGVIVGAILAGTLSVLIPIPFVGAGIGSGLAFLATIKVLQVVDDFFIKRATERAFLPDEDVCIEAQT